jgi:hypothetical protein
MIWTLLQATDDIENVKSGYRSLIFVGCFFIALIIFIIWMIKRS